MILANFEVIVSLNVGKLFLNLSKLVFREFLMHSMDSSGVLGQELGDRLENRIKADCNSMESRRRQKPGSSWSIS